MASWDFLEHNHGVVSAVNYDTLTRTYSVNGERFTEEYYSDNYADANEFSKRSLKTEELYSPHINTTTRQHEINFAEIVVSPPTTRTQREGMGELASKVLAIVVGLIIITVPVILARIANTHHEATTPKQLQPVVKETTPQYNTLIDSGSAF